VRVSIAHLLLTGKVTSRVRLLLSSTSMVLVTRVPCGGDGASSPGRGGLGCGAVRHETLTRYGLCRLGTM
jgi:hypothetical protein